MTTAMHGSIPPADTYEESTCGRVGTRLVAGWLMRSIVTNDDDHGGALRDADLDAGHDPVAVCPRGGVFHVCYGEARTLCGVVLRLGDDADQLLVGEVPVLLRCRRHGCAENWDTDD